MYNAIPTSHDLDMMMKLDEIMEAYLTSCILSKNTELMIKQNKSDDSYVVRIIKKQHIHMMTKYQIRAIYEFNSDHYYVELDEWALNCQIDIDKYFKNYKTLTNPAWTLPGQRIFSMKVKPEELMKTLSIADRWV